MLLGWPLPSSWKLERNGKLKKYLSLTSMKDSRSLLNLWADVSWCYSCCPHLEISRRRSVFLSTVAFFFNVGPHKERKGEIWLDDKGTFGGKNYGYGCVCEGWSLNVAYQTLTHNYVIRTKNSKTAIPSFCHLSKALSKKLLLSHVFIIASEDIKGWSIIAPSCVSSQTTVSSSLIFFFFLFNFYNRSIANDYGPK